LIGIRLTIETGVIDSARRRNLECLIASYVKRPLAGGRGSPQATSLLLPYCSMTIERSINVRISFEKRFEEWFVIGTLCFEWRMASVLNCSINYLHDRDWLNQRCRGTSA
jgi:hypothetical protein